MEIFLDNESHLGYIWDMERINKTILLEKPLADMIQELADRERRSFTMEAQVLLEAALERQKQPEPAEQGKA
jgi:hypothetical protein